VQKNCLWFILRYLLFVDLGVPNAEATPVLLEWTRFSDNLNADELDLLKTRIDELCALLADTARPSSMLLPISVGYMSEGRTAFAIAYQLPSFADPYRDELSLYSILRTNKRSIAQEKRKVLLPALEQRYQLAAILADGLLSLLSTGWIHKGLNSSNIILFHEKDSPFPVDLSHPLMTGFGVSRPEEPGERTIDVRSLDSPFVLWQHPELRQSPHRRAERRHDIFALGMVLFEIGMWQDLHHYAKEKDTAFDFRQRIVNTSQSRLGHYMGDRYKAVVLLCIDQDDAWTETSTGRDEEYVSLLERFSWDVVRELEICSDSLQR
jgi:hypothetical protein